MNAKSIKNDLKKDYPFRAENSPKSQKSEPGLKMCPKPPGRVPRHPKYSKIIKKRAPGPPKSLEIMRIW